jgi:UDP-glucuronate 4-epimerase
MRALVTGCAGFIGSHLVESLLARGDNVLGVDCLLENYDFSIKSANLAPSRDFETFTFAPIDLTRDDLTDIIADSDVIFHLAAEPGVRTSWGARFESYERNNVLATQRLLESAKAWHEKRFIFASSSSIYGEAERLPTPEATMPRPLSPYGVTKLTAEHLCHLYHANHGVQAVSLRYFSVYGPRQRPDMAFHRFCLAALERRPLSVLGDGTQSRDFTFVSDIIAATLAAAVSPVAPGEIYNVGAGCQISLSEAIDVLESIAGRRLEVEFLAEGKGDVRATAADINKARRDLAYSPTSAFEDSLGDEFQWASENLHLLATTST